MKRRNFVKQSAMITSAVSIFPGHIFGVESKTFDGFYDQIMNGTDKKRRQALRTLEEDSIDKDALNLLVDRVINRFDDNKTKYNQKFPNRRDKIRFIGDDMKRRVDIASSFGNLDSINAKHFSLKNVALNMNFFTNAGLEAYVDGYPVGSYPVVRSLVRSNEMQAKDIVRYIKSQSLETGFYDEDAAILFFLVAYKIKQSGLTFEEGKKYLYNELKDWKDETSVGNPARVKLINKIRSYCQDQSLTFKKIITPKMPPKSAFQGYSIHD